MQIFEWQRILQHLILVYFVLEDFCNRIETLHIFPISVRASRSDVGALLVRLFAGHGSQELALPQVAPYNDVMKKKKVVSDGSVDQDDETSMFSTSAESVVEASSVSEALKDFRRSKKLILW